MRRVAVWQGKLGPQSRRRVLVACAGGRFKATSSGPKSGCPKFRIHPQSFAETRPR